MQRKRLFRLLFLSSLLIAIISSLLIAWAGALAARRHHLQQTTGHLESIACLVAPAISDAWLAGDSARVAQLCRKYGATSHARITFVAVDGSVIGDSVQEAASIHNQTWETEIIAALDGRRGVDIRHDEQTEKDELLIAIPANSGPHHLGAVRVSVMIEPLISNWPRALGIGAILLLAMSIIIALVSNALARSITSPLEELKRGADRFAQGDLAERLPVLDSEETGSLAESMNDMAAHLDERIRAALRQRNERDAMLSSMLEGVLAVDNDERVIELNRAAGSLLGIDWTQAHGRTIQEVIRNSDLQRFVAGVLRNRQTQEGDLVLRDESGDRFMQLHGTTLLDERDQAMGALVVLNDVTRLRRLEGIRRDFVANVSHELKTPITSIKGFVETLQEGAMNDPDDARRFLDIVARHSDRLNSIIDDLLTLSRIEQEAEGAEISLEEDSLAEVLQNAVQACAVSAGAKAIAIKLDCPSDLIGRMNAPLLEQAVVNLLDNAIKFSEEGAHVTLQAGREGREIAIRVRDNGPGIAPEHLPRLFERFYRVDKGRSRKMGGTGLGLAIVKHITQAHGGKAGVESTPGAGSVFTITLPVN